MINIKTVAATVAAVTVAGVSAHQIITRTRKPAPALTLVTLRVPDMSAAAAWNMAQDTITERMLSGFYDDKSDDVVRHDFQILYNTYLAA